MWTAFTSFFMNCIRERLKEVHNDIQIRTVLISLKATALCKATFNAQDLQLLILDRVGARICIEFLRVVTQSRGT